MRFVIDIKDSERDFFLKMLKNLSFVKTVEVENSEESFLNGLKDAVEEVKLHKEGKKELGLATGLLNEI